MEEKEIVTLFKMTVPVMEEIGYSAELLPAFEVTNTDPKTKKKEKVVIKAAVSMSDDEGKPLETLVYPDKSAKELTRDEVIEQWNDMIIYQFEKLADGAKGWRYGLKASITLMGKKA